MDNTHTECWVPTLSSHRDGGWLLIALLTFPEGEDKAATDCWLVSILLIPKNHGALTHHLVTGWQLPWKTRAQGSLRHARNSATLVLSSGFS